MGKGAAVFLSDNAFNEGIFENNKILMLNILEWLSKFKNTSTGINGNFYNLNLKTSFNLDQNYPNPFSSSTTISFNIPYPSLVTISVYNTLGQRILTLLDEKKEQGNYTVIWNSLNNEGHLVNNGLYYIEMNADKFHAIRKAILLK